MYVVKKAGLLTTEVTGIRRPVFKTEGSSRIACEASWNGDVPAVKHVVLIFHVQAKRVWKIIDSAIQRNKPPAKLQKAIRWSLLFLFVTLYWIMTPFRSNWWPSGL